MNEPLKELSNFRNAKRISVIDDNYDIVKPLDYALTKAGYTVAFAQNADDGIAIVKGDNPELIILDVSMPGGNGDEMLRKLRSFDWGQSIPVILYSNYDSYANLADAPELAPVKFASKSSYNLGEMVKLVESMLEK